MKGLTPIVQADKNRPGVIDRTSRMPARKKILAHVGGRNFKVADYNLEPVFAAPKRVGVDKHNITSSVDLDLHCHQNPNAAFGSPLDAVLTQNELPRPDSEVLS